jgi:hypothetical protein
VSDSLPWPEVGVIAIHAAFVVAVHVQSRLVEIASVPDIPSAGAARVAAFSTMTSHLAAVGEVTEMAEEDPVHALERHPSAQSANSRARMPRVHSASSLPSVSSAGGWTSRPDQILHRSVLGRPSDCFGARILQLFPDTVFSAAMLTLDFCLLLQLSAPLAQILKSSS